MKDIKNNCGNCGHCILDLDLDKMEAKRNCSIDGKSVNEKDTCNFNCPKGMHIAMDNICNLPEYPTYFNTER